jgi:glycosyltransferase involved in cell wall biosynthesis
MPVYNSRDYLQTSLPAIKRSNYPCFELIVVDDHSSDGSAEFARQYADQLIENSSQLGPAAARNRGAQTAKGNIIFFADADVRLFPDTISKAVEVMQDDAICAVFGSYDDRPEAVDFISQYKNLMHHFIHQSAKRQAQTFWAGCGAVRKKDFQEAGGFPEVYRQPSIEDVDLGYRLAQVNKKIILIKEMQVTHLKKWGLLSLLKSDIVQRAIPWTKLSLYRGLPGDLNFKLSDRLSGALACFLFLSFFLSFGIEFFSLLFLLAVIALICLNRKLYGFFLKQRGMNFVIAGMGFHWLYLFYSTVTFMLVFPVFFIKNKFRRVIC